MFPIDEIKSEGLPVKRLLEGIAKNGWDVNSGASKLIEKASVDPSFPGSRRIAYMPERKMPRGTTFRELTEYTERREWRFLDFYDCLLVPYMVPADSLDVEGLVLFHSPIRLPRIGKAGSLPYLLKLVAGERAAGLLTIERVGQGRPIDFLASFLVGTV